MKNKFVCIHGHFYQPPRENAWLEAIEQQESAAPFHDWNERINFECYGTNASARILDNQAGIVNIVNNYSRMSFNIGPTLLSWQKQFDPETYKAIQEADKESQKLFNGHGSAVAQVYSHLIMPLANFNDKLTQVKWGIRDFESHFNRFPEGMWLAETAVNTETLEILARCGIKFTIFAPRQAKAVRNIGSENWHNISNENFDTRLPYRIFLPSGAHIDAFFYDGRIAQSVAFEGLLNSGKMFAAKFTSNFDNNDTPQLAHIATDGESYGHHHKRGEMALADCLNFFEEKSDIKLTNYAAYLAAFPPTVEMQIHENSSWSCVHGIERWKSNCGCNSGYGGWHQEWRGPLRLALNWLRDQLTQVYEEHALPLVEDPWAVRENYIDVILDRSPENIDMFIERFQRRELTQKERVLLLRLLEMQRNSILMFTSCGWFFDEISGLETTQILQYACRAINYAKQTVHVDLEDEFRFRLEKAPSNLPEFQTGQGVYDKNVLPAQVSLVGVGRHFAASSLFEKYPEKYEFYNYIITTDFLERIEAGSNIMVFGRATVHSKITHSKKSFSFAVLYLGQLNLIGNISTTLVEEDFKAMYEATSTFFNNADLAGVIGKLQQYFGPEKFTIWQLFKEQRQKIIAQITSKNMRDVEYAFRNIYEKNYPLMNGLIAANEPIPNAFKDALQYVLTVDIRNLFLAPKLDIQEFKRILNEYKKWNITFTDEAAFKLTAGERILSEVKNMRNSEIGVEHLNALSEIISLLRQINLRPDMRRIQTEYFYLHRDFKTKDKPFPSKEWRKAFYQLGNMLEVRVEEVVNEIS